MLKPGDVGDILRSHEGYWDGQREKMKKYREAYMTRYWNQDMASSYSLLFGASSVQTETSRCYATVESYLGSLYARNPSVFLTADVRARGNAQVAQATANLFLDGVRTQLEDATRLALIYPCSYLKLSPTTSVDPLSRVACTACPPWEVVVDATAGSWDQQRWVGHTYLLPLEEAIARYSKKRASFSARTYTKWIDGENSTNRMKSGIEPNLNIGPTDQWVKILELYDLQNDRLLVYSPDYLGGEKFVFTGVRIQVGALEEEAADEAATAAKLDEDLESYTTGIPYKSANGRPIVPIIPIYFSRDPDSPLRGYSLVERIYSQVRELNIIRTYQAQGVRRMARQWFVREGFLDEEAQAKLAQGIDGEVISVSLQPGAPMEGNIMVAPQAPIPADIQQYANIVESDLQASGVLAPFSKGEATGVTATENRLLQQYTSSDLGRMARTRDQAIVDMAKTYNIMLSLILGDDAEPLALPNPVGPTMLSAQDLTGDFNYYAVDGGATPISDLAKQEAINTIAPLLVQLGTPPDVLLREIVRLYKLPDEFAKIAEAAAPPVEPMAGLPPEEV